MNRYPHIVRYLIWLIFAIAVVFALTEIKTLLVPLFWAVLLAYFLYPMARRLERWKIPRILTNFMVIIGTLVVLAGIGFLFGLLVTNFAQHVPNIKEQFVQNINHLQHVLQNTFGISNQQLKNLSKRVLTAVQFMGTFFTATKNTAIAIGLIPVYTFLILFYRNKFRAFLSMLVKPDKEETLQRIADQAAEIVPKYLKGLFVVCIILFGLNTLGFYVIGLRFAVFLGFVATIFSLIPYIGNIIGYTIVAIFVLATQTPTLALEVVIQFFIVQFIENNILTPNITGSYVEINPLVIIFSLIAGGMIWGLAGLFMVIPYLAMLKIVCENVEGLKPIGFLLSTRGTESHTITIKSMKNYFGWGNHEDEDIKQNSSDQSQQKEQTHQEVN
jgi:predicted PurR-regulated permease PerM